MQHDGRPSIEELSGMTAQDFARMTRAERDDAGERLSAAIETAHEDTKAFILRLHADKQTLREALTSILQANSIEAAKYLARGALSDTE